MRFITRWDLDKTYLRSRFDKFSELVTSALEKAEEKRAVPGATAVLRELGMQGARIHVLSGSPRQLRRRIEAKLRLDGVRWDELTLKPNLSNLVLLRLHALRDQLGYKLPELLAARVRDQEGIPAPDSDREVLVGDDSESDAFVYSLYADLCAGVVDGPALARVFAASKSYARADETCRAALERIQRAPVVKRILIHLDGQTPPSRFARFGPRLVPFYNYLQAAFALLEAGLLDARASLRIAAEFQTHHGFSSETIARSYADLARRGHVDGATPKLLLTALDAALPELGATALSDLRRAIDRMCNEPLPSVRPSEPARAIDYVELAGYYEGGKNRRRPGQRF